MRNAAGTVPVVVLLLVPAARAAGLCGDPGSGTCCLAHDGAGCEDAACCASVCAADPYCCSGHWDPLCADLASAVCAGCPPGPPPANDDCAAAAPVTDGVHAFSTVNATTDGPEHDCDGLCGGDVRFHNDVWFRYVASSSGPLSVSTCDELVDFDTKIAVYQGTGCGNLAPALVACSDQGLGFCPGGASEALLLATRGTTYTIRIGSPTGTTGSGGFSIELGGGCPGEGNCCIDNGTPGCADPQCCAIVCAKDPFCCNVTWDQICANQANLLCNCGGVDCTCPFLGEGDCCIGHGGFGCGNVACCAEVTDADPSCAGAWDAQCADLARHLCPEVCPPLDLGCGPGAGDCCGHNGTPGCEDPACCQAVCAVDPLCCSSAWDAFCAQQAGAICECLPDKEGCGSIDAGPCCLPHETPFCSDGACCDTVCAADPHCCTVTWDTACAEQAAALCSALPIDLPAAVLITGRPAPGSGGVLVASPLGFPTVNGLGRPAVTGALADGDRFVWFDGAIVWRNSDALPVVLGGAQFRMGAGSDGSWAYVPQEDGLDALWVNGQRVVREGDEVIGVGTLLGIQEASMLDDSTVTWLAGYGFPSNQSQAVMVAFQPAVQTGDTFDGYTIGLNSIHMSYDFSGNGEHLIFEAAVGSNSGTEFVVVDGSVVAAEGLPSGQGGAWTSFRDVGVNDSAEYVFSGHASDSFLPLVAINGVIVDHLGLSTPPHVAINDRGDVVAMAVDSFTPVLRHYRRGAGGAVTATDLLVAGSTVRLPIDCSATAAVLDLQTTSNSQPVLELGEVSLYVNATLLTPGKEVVQAVVAVPLPARIGDFDGDGSVGIQDLLSLLAAWGPCPPPPGACPADLDGSGGVGIADLLEFLVNWTG